MSGGNGREHVGGTVTKASEATRVCIIQWIHFLLLHKCHATYMHAVHFNQAKEAEQ